MVSESENPSHLPTPHELIRQFGYRIADAVAERAERQREFPIYPRAGSEDGLDELIADGLPMGPMDPLLLLDRLTSGLLDASANFLHPAMMAWVAATPLPLPGLLDGMLSALRIFPHAWKLTPGSIKIELTVGRWLGQMTGFGADAFGCFTTGGTMANLYGMAAARAEVAGWDVRRHGLSGQPRLVAYASEHAHICIEQSMAMLGLGTDQLRRVPLDCSFSMQVECLARMIKEDLEAGLKPFCIIGTAGSTPTGAVDRLDALADLAREYALWYHIDGSYGALAALEPAKRGLFSGIGRADSLAVDPHKWLNIPFEAGCVLVKDKEALAKAFSCVPSYLSGGDSTQGHDHWHYGFELTRADRATKVLFALHQHGVEAYERMISAHNAYAQRLYSLLCRDPEFEPAHEPALSILCFRYVGNGLEQEEVDTVNSRVESCLQRAGTAMIAATMLQGRPVLRVCFVNHRTHWDDVLVALDQVRQICRDLVAGRSTAGPGAIELEVDK